MTPKTAAKIFSLLALGGLITFIIKEDVFKEEHYYPRSNNYNYNSYSRQNNEFEKGEAKIDSIYNIKLDSLENDYLIKRSRIQREYREKVLEHKVKSSKY